VESLSARFPVAIGLAILVTFFLFWAMQALVTVDGELQEGGQISKIEFVRLKRDTAPEATKREPPKREKPEQPPPPPQMNLAQNMNPGEGVGEIIPVVDTTVELASATSLGAGGGDQDAVPLVRVDPQYPPRAEQRGIEGWVEVGYTISASGTVTEAWVIRASPPSIFDRAALTAVKKWKFNPRIENGQAVERPNMATRVVFELGKKR
jgi:protein TonB